MSKPETNRISFSGVEEVLHNIKAAEVLPEELRYRGYNRALIVCSKTLNTKTDIVREIEKALGDTCVGVTDEVGEHAPLVNIMKAVTLVKELNADILIAIGGGSVIDFCRMLQLCISEGVDEKKDIFQYAIGWEGNRWIFGSKAKPKIRQITIPTTLATAEWTLGCSPVDEETNLKTMFIVPQGGPEMILYDPEILSQTPLHLTLSTAVRGLDHAINTRCAEKQHPMANVLTERAITLSIENLPKLKKDPQNLETVNNCQLATWFTGAVQQSAMHGFSHFMVHILAPIAGASHSDAACVLMLAQARWLEGYADDAHGAIKRSLGRENEPLHKILEELLLELEMPTTLEELNVTPDLIEKMIQPALDYHLVTAYNVRPIKTGDDIKAVLDLAWAR